MAARKWVSVKEVAKLLGVCTKTVMRLVDRGKLPRPVRLSARCVRFDWDELAAFLEEAKRFVAGSVMAGGVLS